MPAACVIIRMPYTFLGYHKCSPKKETITTTSAVQHDNLIEQAAHFPRT
jgi:hypothetical protein